MKKPRKPKSEEDKRRERNNRLKRLYGITIKEYEERFAYQKGTCAICLNPPTAMPLAVDHDHKWKYLKLTVEDGVIGYVARVNIEAHNLSAFSPYYLLNGVGETKNEAKATLRLRLKRASVRGLLCFSCNGGLRKYRDTPDNLMRAAKYLRDHQGS